MLFELIVLSLALKLFLTVPRPLMIIGMTSDITDITAILYSYQLPFQIINLSIFSFSFSHNYSYKYFISFDVPSFAYAYDVVLNDFYPDVLHSRLIHTDTISVSCV